MHPNLFPVQLGSLIRFWSQHDYSVLLLPTHPGGDLLIHGATRASPDPPPLGSTRYDLQFRKRFRSATLPMKALGGFQFRGDRPPCRSDGDLAKVNTRVCFGCLIPFPPGLWLYHVAPERMRLTRSTHLLHLQKYGSVDSDLPGGGDIRGGGCTFWETRQTYNKEELRQKKHIK